jgi:hypothetical protein
MRPTVSWGKIS